MSDIVMTFHGSTVEEKPTGKLRFVQRYIGTVLRHILQQEWHIHETEGHTHIVKLEWRDVPVEVET